jgi:hypothetical protein
MAAFDVKPAEQQVPNFTGASQGIRASANTGLGDLFKGLAATLDMGIQEADRNEQQKIQNDIFDQVDTINNEFGVGDATDLQADAEAPARPAQLESAGEQLDRLQAAYEAGVLKESHYWARMNSMVRQLRGKYPGYRPEIDQMVSGIVGAKPANALRNALFNEWSAASAQQKSVGDLAEWMAKSGTVKLPSDYFLRVQNGDPYSYTELLASLTDQTSQQAEVSNRRAALALQADQGTANEKQAESNFRVEANQMVVSLLQDTGLQVGKNFQQFREKLREYQNSVIGGKGIDATELVALSQGFEQLKNDLNLALLQKYNETWDGDPNHSYVALLETSTRDDVIKNALGPVLLMQAGLTGDKSISLVESTQAYLEAMKAQDKRKILDGYPVIRELSALADTLGPSLSSSLLGLSSGVESDLAKALIDMHDAEIFQGKPTTVTDMLSTGVSTGQGPDYYNSIIDRWTGLVDAVRSGDVPQEQLGQKAKAMFSVSSQAVLATMDEGSQYEYFRRVTSPIVTQQMLSLKNAGDTEAWQYYQSWVTGAFMSLFQKDVTDLQGFNTDPVMQGMTVTWDPKNLAFKFKLGSDYGATPPGTHFGGPGDFPIGFGASGDIGSRLNTAIRNVAPIFTENGGDVAQEVFIILQRMGFNPSAKRNKAIGDAMIESLGRTLMSGSLQSRGAVTVPIMDNRPEVNTNGR